MAEQRRMGVSANRGFTAGSPGPQAAAMLQPVTMFVAAFNAAV